MAAAAVALLSLDYTVLVSTRYTWYIAVHKSLRAEVQLQEPEKGAQAGMCIYPPLSKPGALAPLLSASLARESQKSKA